MKLVDQLPNERGDNNWGTNMKYSPIYSNTFSNYTTNPCANRIWTILFLRKNFDESNGFCLNI